MTNNDLDARIALYREAEGVACDVINQFISSFSPDDDIKAHVRADEIIKLCEAHATEQVKAFAEEVKDISLPFNGDRDPGYKHFCSGTNLVYKRIDEVLKRYTSKEEE
jgi:hypothetical protein